MLYQIIRRLREIWEGDPNEGVFSDHDSDGKRLFSRIRYLQARLHAERDAVLDLTSREASLRDLAASVDEARRTAEQGLDLAELYVERAKACSFPTDDIAKVTVFAAECEKVLRFQPRA